MNSELVSGATSASWTLTPETSGSYTIYVNVLDAVGILMKSNTATVTVNPAVTPSPSSTTVVTVSNNSATVDQSSTTGVTIAVNGPSLQDGAQLNVTSTNYGNDQPEGTGETPVETALFYAVDVTSNGEALSEVSGALTFSDPSFNSGSIIEYWNGSIWTPVDTKFTAPDTASCIISAISAQIKAKAAIPPSVLTGTPILVGKPRASTTTSPLDATSLSIIIIIVVAIIVVLGVLFAYLRKRKAM